MQEEPLIKCVHTLMHATHPEIEEGKRLDTIAEQMGYAPERLNALLKSGVPHTKVEFLERLGVAIDAKSSKEPASVIASHLEALLEANKKARVNNVNTPLEL